MFSAILPVEQLTPLYSLGRSLSSSNQCLGKTVVLFFFPILEQWKCNGKRKRCLCALEKGTWWSWWCLLSRMWNSWTQHQGIRSARRNEGNKTGTQRLTQILRIFHTPALTATTAEIVSSPSRDSHSPPILTLTKLWLPRGTWRLMWSLI